jgi:hypothetical protein
MPASGAAAFRPMKHESHSQVVSEQKFLPVDNKYMQ